MFWWWILLFQFSINTTDHFEDVASLKDSVNKHLVSLLKACFALAGPAMQPAIADIQIFLQTVANWTGHKSRKSAFEDSILLE